jgi:imidazolonepropionase-like amidohydrolase
LAILNQEHVMSPARRPEAIRLRSARMLDIVEGELREPGDVLVVGDHIAELAPTRVPEGTVTIELGDLTLLPGLMDMEVNLLLGGPDHRSPLNAVQDDPALRTLRAVVNARRTLRAGFTTVRNLGLFVQTGGLLLDVALKKAIDRGYIDGPRVVPAGHAICPTGGHLDPTMFQAFAPHVLPLTVEEGIANGVAEVRLAVRYQIKYGAELIKVCASGGVMSHTGPAGAQQYSDEELRTVVDEAHRAGLRVAAHAHGDDGIRAAIEAGIDCIEHGSLMSDETIDLMVERGRFLVATTYLADGMDLSHAAPELQAKAADVFPKAKQTISKAIAKGVKIACGTDAPAIPHGHNAKELLALVDRGMSPLQALRAATTVAAELIDKQDRGRIEEGLLADIIAVPGDPVADIGVTENVRFVMKGGIVYELPGDVG